MFVDPLAEKYPNWAPYHYVHNNPINMVDPTGMEGEGWIETNAEGTNNTQLTYDSEVNTKEEAIRKGYKNVNSVSEKLYFNDGNSNESYNLNKDGSVTNNNTNSTTDVGFNPIRTSDGTYISENNGLKQTSQALQSGGDVATYTGLALAITGVGAPLGSGFAFVGEWTNFAGTLIESGYLISQGKKREGITKILMSAFFIGTGKVGTWRTQKAAGKEAVENGLNNSAETVVGGTNTIIEKVIGPDVEKKINKK